MLGTLALLRKTALAAATVAAAEIAVNTATHAMVSHPVLRHLTGDSLAREWSSPHDRIGAGSCGGLFSNSAWIGTLGQAGYRLI
jgi:hypothetical protein